MPASPLPMVNADAMPASRRGDVLAQADAEHQRKNLLFVISQWAQLLDERWERLDPADRAAGFAAIRQSVDALLSQSEAILAGARAEATVLAAELERVDLSAVATVAGRQWHDPSRSAVIVEAGDALPVLVEPGALQQVIGHLVENAVKYSPGATPVLLRTFEADGWAMLEVLDEGMGIPEGVDIFAPFERGDMDARGIPGTGVGLYVVSRLVAGMSGTIVAERRPSGGSRFVVALPLAHPEG